MPDKCKMIDRYGCTLCQVYHYKGENIFDDHLYFQDKHGVNQIPLKTYLKFNKFNQLKSEDDHA